MELTQEDLMEAATSTQRPIAGQSLVEDPATSSPYTNPPKFTNKEEAIDFFIESFLEPSRYQAIMDSLAERAGVKFEIVGKDEDDPEDDEEGVVVDEVDIDFSELDNPFGEQLKTITNPQDDKDFSIETKLDNIPSLMAKGEG